MVTNLQLNQLVAKFFGLDVISYSFSHGKGYLLTKTKKDTRLIHSWTDDLVLALALPSKQIQVTSVNHPDIYVQVLGPNDLLGNEIAKSPEKLAKAIVVAWLKANNLLTEGSDEV